MARLHRFFGNFALDQARIEIIDPDFIHQCKNVLRVEVGEDVLLANGHGQEATATLVELAPRKALFEIAEVKENKNEPERSVTLYAAILKRENFEWIAQKATEIGVHTIIPIHTNHTIKLALNRERIQKIIKEAAEQSGRGIVPILGEILDFSQAVESASKEHEINFACDASGKEITAKISAKNIGIFIGPEGGWNDAELATFKELKFNVVSLGALTLRAETAAIVSLYSILNG